MNKLTYILFLTFVNVLFSQNETLTNFTINYETSLSIDQPKNYNSTLIIKNYKSYFHWNNIIDKSSSSTDDLGNYKFHIDITDEIGTINYLNFRTDSIYSRSLWFKDVIVLKEKRTKIKWNLLDDKKKIAGYNCFKAIGKFRGRTYTVWYTLEIPLAVGPWKLNGLPGAILEAFDDEKIIQFYFKSIKKDKGKDITNYNDIFSKGKVLSIKEYEKAQKNLASDIMNKIKSKLPRGASISFEPSTDNFLEKEFNNPK